MRKLEFIAIIHNLLFRCMPLTLFMWSLKNTYILMKQEGKAEL